MTDIAELLQVVAFVALGLVAYSGYHRGTRAVEAAGRANLVADYLMDRCGVSAEDVDRWHREVHPDCFDDEPRGGAS